MSTRLAHSFFFIFLALAAGGQTPVFKSRPAKEMNPVRATTLYQDHLGWMWLGGDGGLIRYDGLTFETITLPDSLSKDPVTAIYEANDQLWVGFRSGSICILPGKTAFLPSASQHSQQKSPHVSPLQRWTPEEGTPAQPITAFCSDSSGGLWIATYGEGLYCWKNKRLYQFDTDEGLSSLDIYTISCDGAGQVWAATDAGISICAMPTPGVKNVRTLNTANGLPDEIVSALMTDRSGDMWIGTYDRGICRYRVAEQKLDYPVRDWAYGPVTGLASFGKRELWVGTRQHGLLRLSLGAKAEDTAEIFPLPDAHPLRHANIAALLKDREGLLWALDARGTLYSANVRATLLSTPFPDVQAVYVDRSNRLWAGAATGLFLCEKNTFRQVLPRPENVVSLWEDPRGNLWVGTFGNGVYVLAPSGKILRRLTEKDGLPNGSVLSISGNARDVWLATLGGAVELPLDGQGANTFRAELGTGYVYTVLADRRGRVWFGTDGQGLAVLEQGRFRRFSQAAGHALKKVYCVTEDRDGNIWFCNEKDGLYRYDGANFRRYGTEDHLHSINISGLAMDGNGYLAIAYDDGVDLLTPATGHVAFYDAAAGAPNVENSLNAICRDAQGNLWMGARSGILRLAAYDEFFVYDPEPNITAVSVFLQPFDFWANTTFPYDQNYFLFNFTGLWFTNPDLVRYRYRLEGSENEWIISKEHFASYPNLPPGRYTFLLQASEHGEFEGTPLASYSFTIRPPFWTRWWFVTLCLLLGAGLLYLLIQTREQHLHRSAALRRESVESQFAALKSQINPHFLFNSFNTLITIIEENPKVAVEYVEHLSDFYRSILVYREKDLITLEEEIDLVRNFYFLLKKRYEDNFSLNCTVNGHAGYLMPLTLQMLVENAVKHNIISSARPLTVDIFVDEAQNIVVRNNNQRKANPERGTHFGLQSLIHRYELLGTRRIVVEETERFFSVRVPIL